MEAHRRQTTGLVRCAEDPEGLKESGFYGWRNRAPSARTQANALLSEQISRIHRDSREPYGAPRVHFELRTLGVRCAR